LELIAADIGELAAESEVVAVTDLEICDPERGEIVPA